MDGDFDDRSQGPVAASDGFFGQSNSAYPNHDASSMDDRRCGTEDNQSALFSLDPLLQALTPASAPPDSSEYALAGTTPTPSSASLGLYRSSSSSSSSPPNNNSRNRLTASPSATKSSQMISSHTLVRNGSTTKHSDTRSRSGSLRSQWHAPPGGISSTASKRRSLTLASVDNRPPPLSLHLIASKDSDSPVSEKGKARAIDAPTLLDRLKNGRSVGAQRDFMVIDVRSLPNFIADNANGSPSRLLRSLNVNFPSLLMKRFRKGNVASFSLESFITTPSGHTIFELKCPSKDLLDVDIVIVDEKIAKKDFDNVQSTGCTGAVLVNLLEKRRMEKSSTLSGMGELLYYEGDFVDLLAKAKGSPEYMHLVSSGPDERDLLVASPGSTILNADASLSPTDNLPTPTLNSARISSIPIYTSPTKPSTLKQRAKPLPQLSLPLSISSPMLSLKSQPNAHHIQPPLASPGLSRSSSSNLVPLLQEQQLPVQTGGIQRKQRPTQLKRLDTSDRIKQARLQVQTGNQPAPLLLAPPKSFQELAMAQAATPTKANFASAANAGPSSRNPVAYGADDYSHNDLPPPSPSVGGFGHGRSDSTASIRSNSQYPSMPDGLRNAFPPDLATPGAGGERGRGQVAPFQVSVIIPGFLYLGPEPVKVSDVEELQSAGIKRILNMAVECETLERWGSTGRFEKIANIPMRDSLAETHVQERIREACVLLGMARACYKLAN